MSVPATATASPRSKSGSEKRRRTACLPRIRCGEEHRAVVAEAANRAGLSLASYMLQTLVNAPPPKGGRVPPVERQALAQLLAQLGRLNGNVNQIAKAVNSGITPEAQALREAAAEIMGLRNEVRAMLGRGQRDYQG